MRKILKSIYSAILSPRSRIAIKIDVMKLFSIFYYGHNFSCNCCNKNFRKFIPKGTVKVRENAVCPYCMSLERTRLLQFYLKNETSIFKGGKSVLHFAPEHTLLKQLKKINHLLYIPCDIDPNMGEYEVDITNIPFPENTFDFIICLHVLGFVNNEEKAVEEMKRVLKPGGTAIIMTLIDWNLKTTHESPDIVTEAQRLKHYTEPDALRLHGADFKEKLMSFGINAEQIDYRQKLGLEICQKFSLGNGEREMIFKCTK